MRHPSPPQVGLLAFFLCCWAICAWVFSYVYLLQSESADSFFMFGWQYLATWLARPGGLSIYASRFLRQFSLFGWLGALITSVLATLLGLFAHRIAQRVRPTSGLLHALLPALALVALQMHGLDVALGVLALYGAFLVFLSLSGSAARWLGAVVATFLLYLFAGAFAWPFALWVLVRESVGRPPLSGLGRRALYLALVIALPLVAYRWFFAISLPVAFRHPVYLSGSALHYGLIAYLALLPVGLLVPGPRLATGLLAWARRTRVQAAVVAVLAALLLGAAHDPGSAEAARYHRLYRAGDWDAILATSRAEPSPSGMAQFFTNYALAKKGRLLDEMFHYPQLWGTDGLILSSSTEDTDLRRALYTSDLLFEMGHTNAAFRLAYNQLNLGRSYANLRRLAECNIANGSYEIARKYLRLLDQTLFHRRYARRYLMALADPPAADTCLARVRRLRPQLELHLDLGTYAALLNLVESKPDNRLALDYLVAWCLLDKDALPMAIAATPRLRAAGYTSLPTHCQEGLLLWAQLSDAPLDELAGAVDPSTREHFDEFGCQVAGYADRVGARGGLEEGFGSTYMFYYAVAEPAGRRPPPFTWVRLANELRAQGRVDLAMPLYYQALRIPGRYGDAHLYLADALAAQGRLGEAARHYQQVIEVDPATQQVRLRLDRAWQLGSH